MSRPAQPSAVNAGNFRLVCSLAGAFAVLTIALGIAPWHRQDWLLENLPVVAALFVLWSIYRYLPFSRISWVLVFLFLCLHEIGAHYTYSEVPWREWWNQSAGSPVLETGTGTRNHFDRFIHFAYGLLLALPLREIFAHVAHARGFWSYFLPFDVIMSSSAFYEIIEWMAAEVFGGELGIAYVGSQGDPWDAQKDMALATIGVLFGLGLTALIHFRLSSADSANRVPR